MAYEKPMEEIKQDAADLYWLAFLLTGSSDLSVDIAADSAAEEDAETSFFSGWMQGWRRRLVIAKALNIIHDPLADSARRTAQAYHKGATTPRNWSLNPGMTKADVEKALLAIDAFPRAALLLLLFEGVAMPDAATLLDADPALVKKAQEIGLRELIANLAGIFPRDEDRVMRLPKC